MKKLSFIFILSVLLISFIIGYIIFSPIYKSTSIYISYGLVPYDICKKQPELWNAVKIIFMEKELHSDTFCSNTYIFDKYNKGKLIYTDRKRIKVINLLEESCGLTY